MIATNDRSARPGGAYTCREQVCDECGNAEKLKTCAKCHFALYCSSECQNRQWPEHRKVCKDLSRQTAALLQLEAAEIDAATYAAAVELEGELETTVAAVCQGGISLQQKIDLLEEALQRSEAFERLLHQNADIAAKVHRTALNGTGFGSETRAAAQRQMAFINDKIARTAYSLAEMRRLLAGLRPL